MRNQNKKRRLLEPILSLDSPLDFLNWVAARFEKEGSEKLRELHRGSFIYAFHLMSRRS